MLLHELRRGGCQGGKERKSGVAFCGEGRWDLLRQASRATAAVRRQRSHVLPDSIEDWAQRLEKAEQLASRGELSSASRLLRSNGETNLRAGYAIVKIEKCC